MISYSESFKTFQVQQASYNSLTETFPMTLSVWAVAWKTDANLSHFVFFTFLFVS